MDLAFSDRMREATRWLMHEGRATADAGALVRGFAEMLVRLGVPATRATTHAPTLHPEFRWVMQLWHFGQPVGETRRSHGIEDTATFRGNPVEHVVNSGEWLDCRLDDPEAQRFATLRDLRGEGYTHYVMAPLRSSEGIVGAASWATVAAAGFGREDLLLLHEIVPLFSLVFETKGLRRVLGELLEAYVGRDPARRILEGRVRRGDVRRIRAAIMLTDMRGFGELSDSLSEERVVDMLNQHLDCIVPAILAEGGEVLKFIGDGVLAVFGTDRGDENFCQAAYRAAQAALAAVASYNAAGGFERIRLETGIALHCGEVAYGNIGSGGRLDFTAIGRDVNIVSRLERLCAPLGRSLLMSAEFVSRVELPAVEIGQFELKGFKRRAAVFGDPDEEPGPTTAHSAAAPDR